MLFYSYNLQFVFWFEFSLASLQRYREVKILISLSYYFSSPGDKQTGLLVKLRHFDRNIKKYIVQNLILNLVSKTAADRSTINRRTGSLTHEWSRFFQDLKPIFRYLCQWPLFNSPYPKSLPYVAVISRRHVNLTVSVLVKSKTY